MYLLIVSLSFLFSVMYSSYFSLLVFFFSFFFNDTATTEIYTLSLHDALPISRPKPPSSSPPSGLRTGAGPPRYGRSEEHTSELQSHSDLVCRLLLEKKKKKKQPKIKSNTDNQQTPV